MALKDQLNDALAATAPEDKRRQETLRAVLDAARDGGDAEIQAALARIISEREQKAASFNAAGQTELAKAERGEIDALRTLLRQAGEPPPAPKKKAPSAAPTPTPDAVSSAFTRTQMILGLVAIAAVAVVLFFVLRPSGDNGTVVAAGGGSGEPIKLYKDDRTLGNPKAPVVLLEYAAPTCPHCAHFAINTFPVIKKRFIDTGKVFYIFRTFPLQATDGAVEGLARCLPADKYFSFLDLMFRNQPKWDPDGYQIPDVGAALIQMAKLVGMSPAKAKECMEDRKTQEYVNQVAQDAELKYRIDSTPTFIINGEKVQLPFGQTPGDTVIQKIDSLLSKK